MKSEYSDESNSTWGYVEGRNSFFISNGFLGLEHLPCSTRETAQLMHRYISESMRTMEEGLRAISRAINPEHVYSGLSDEIKVVKEQAKSHCGVLGPIQEDQKTDGE